MAWDVADGDRGILSYVQSDILRNNSRLEFSCVRMFTPAAENAWDLHCTVSNSLQVSIKESVLHFGGNRSISFLLHLFLLSGTSIAQLALFLNVLLDMSKVKVLQALGAKRLRKQG